MKRDTKIAASVFIAIPIAILSASLACTWAIAHGASMEWRILFRLFCHGIPERCLTVWGVPMPVCARCTAAYSGFLAGLGGFWLVPWVEEKTLRIALFASAALMAVDGVSQALRLRESTNVLRVATGLPLGIAFGMWALSAIERRGKREFSMS